MWQGAMSTSRASVRLLIGDALHQKQMQMNKLVGKVC